MADINGISKNLIDQFNLLENNVSKTTYRFRDVESYINRRVKKLKKLIPSMAKSKNLDKLSSIIDLFGEVQNVLEKLEELEGSVVKIKEIPIDGTEIMDLAGQEIIEDD